MCRTFPIEYKPHLADMVFKVVRTDTRGMKDLSSYGGMMIAVDLPVILAVS